MKLILLIALLVAALMSGCTGSMEDYACNGDFAC
jgi:uncharacterized protein YceK